jgi:hypothetical protein
MWLDKMRIARKYLLSLSGDGLSLHGDVNVLGRTAEEYQCACHRQYLFMIEG